MTGPIVVAIYAINIFIRCRWASIMCLFGRDVLLPTTLTHQYIRIEASCLTGNLPCPRTFLLAILVSFNRESDWRAPFAIVTQPDDQSVASTFIRFLLFCIIPLWIQATISFVCTMRIDIACAVVPNRNNNKIRSEKKTKWKRLFIIIYRCPEHRLHIFRFVSLLSVSVSQCSLSASSSSMECFWFILLNFIEFTVS